MVYQEVPGPYMRRRVVKIVEDSILMGAW